MIGSRLRECLKVLRWDESDLADQLGYTENEIASWLDGRAAVPLVVGAWLEALVKAYRALPLPRQEQSASTSDAPIKLPSNVESVMRANRHPLNGTTAQLPYSHRAAAGSVGGRSGAVVALSRGGLNHASRSL
ncbi:helix-turn-helix domain-containing protein [Rhizobiales bacterium 3FA27D7]|uniref:helix-turn-helix domain-containing protein n=1 Tax=Mesorhizobium sp. 2RAF21 TaxID=3232995 RepID=UPI0010FA1B04